MKFLKAIRITDLLSKSLSGKLNTQLIKEIESVATESIEYQKRIFVLEEDMQKQEINHKNILNNLKFQLFNELAKRDCEILRLRSIDIEKLS
jgi:hypothetical protein